MKRKNYKSNSDLSKACRYRHQNLYSLKDMIKALQDISCSSVILNRNELFMLYSEFHKVSENIFSDFITKSISVNLIDSYKFKV